jgi:hypothetical protein
VYGWMDGWIYVCICVRMDIMYVCMYGYMYVYMYVCVYVGPFLFLGDNEQRRCFDLICITRRLDLVVVVMDGNTMNGAGFGNYNNVHVRPVSSRTNWLLLS